MASHVQSQKRQSDRSPGILHPLGAGAALERQADERGEKVQYDARWRVISAFALVIFGLLLTLIFTNDLFYVQSIEVRGNVFLTREEIFAFSGMADYHIFWLDPTLIRANLLRSPSVADASVELGWPPNIITIQVEERQPALIWSAASNEVWIDLQGRVMPVGADMPELLRVTVAAGASDGQVMDVKELEKETVLGALQMQEFLPGGTHLDYHPVYGLGWTNSKGWQIWVGDGAGMSEKIRIYAFLLDNLTSRGIDIEELNIANPDAPFYRVLWGP